MADISNRRLAEIITMTAEKIQSNVLKERKIANDLENTSVQLQNSINEIDGKITILKSTSLEPDLSKLNDFYEERTAENVSRLNSRLKVPNFVVYVWVGSMMLFLGSGLFLWQAMKSKQEIISEYRTELQKDNVLTSKVNSILFNDMLEWFSKNPKTKQNFINWKEERQTK